MNCQLCQKEFDAYREDILPEGTRSQVEAHLRECKVCAESFQLVGLAGKVMEEEKSMQSNPFLVTRIMANLGELEQNRENYQYTPFYIGAIRPFLISVSIAAAVSVGIMAGRIYDPKPQSHKLPIEMTYMNDAALESVDLFSSI
ncbi:MAG: zf-HC2 domain-containing protein [Mariniphaga sp.]